MDSKLDGYPSEHRFELLGMYAVRVHQCRYDWFRQKLVKRRLAPWWRWTQSKKRHGASGLNVPRIVFTPPAQAPQGRCHCSHSPKFLLISARAATSITSIWN